MKLPVKKIQCIISNFQTESKQGIGSLHIRIVVQITSRRPFERTTDPHCLRKQRRVSRIGPMTPLQDISADNIVSCLQLLGRTVHNNGTVILVDVMPPDLSNARPQNIKSYSEQF